MARVLMPLLMALGFGCGGGGVQGHASGPVNLPLLQGRPVYSRPLADAPPAVAVVWREVEEALGMAEAADWAQERTRVIQRLDPEWGRLDQGEVDEILFSAVTRGLLLDELATRLSRVAGSESRVDQAAEEARRAYATCVRQAPSAAELLQDWGGTCLERSTALESLTDH